MMTTRRFRGVLPILATPFDDDESVLADELGSLVRWEVGLGVDGVVCLGVAGEAFRLTDEERGRVVRVVVEAVDGAVPVVAGVTATGTRMVEHHIGVAAEAGCAGVLVAPPIVPGIRPDAVLDYYRRVGRAAGEMTVVVQDEPNATGVRMTPELIATVLDELPNARAAKIEDPPTGRKITRIRDLVQRDDEVAYFGGLGGQYLLTELQAGGAGAMTGFAFPEVLLDICGAFWDGDPDTARDVFYRHLPLMQFEFQPVLGVAVRKAALRLRGVLQHVGTRHPGPVLDRGTWAELEHLVDRLGLRDGYTSVRLGSRP